MRVHDLQQALGLQSSAWSSSHPMPIDPATVKLLESAALVRITIDKTEKKPTSAEDWHMHVEGRLGDSEEDENDVEWGALGFLYAVAVLSFADARPRGASDRDFVPDDEFHVVDLFEHLRFQRGELHLETDYLRGRCLKTFVRVRSNGTFLVETTNRGEAVTRWLARLQGRKPLMPVPDNPR